ncbi:hypothetical protein BGX27_008128 [Mortierella sp. AM989]|nr:hypothetical protein BGX27_008128 [Mortierella sp. AM989]
MGDVKKVAMGQSVRNRHHSSQCLRWRNPINLPLLILPLQEYTIGSINLGLQGGVRSYLGWLDGLPLSAPTALTPATLVMFHLGVLFGWQLFNLIPIRALGYLSIASGLAVALISAMLSMAEFGPSMSHIPFTAFLNYSGSSSAVYAALSSTLMASFVFCPQDTIIRMAEESRRPERTMGKLMVVSSLSTLLAGLPLVIVLNYGTIKPIKGLLDEMVPSIRVITETLGKVTGAVFVILVLVAMFSTGVIRLAAASRTVYSFARDGGLPRSSYWNHLHPSRKTPQRVSWLVTAASTPLWMRLTHEGSLHFIPGNFTLGRFSRPLHIISIIWLLLLSLFLMLPPTYPITKNNFNYAPVVMTILGLLFGISWFKARTDFTGGAKDVSRASHQIPSDTYKDIYPMKPQSRAQSQYYHEGSLESESRSMGSSHHKQPTHTTMQKAKNYSTLDKSRYAYAHNFGTNQPPTSRFESLQQQKQQQRRQQISLTPPRRGPVIVNKKQQHQQLQPDNSTLRSPSSNFTSQLGQCSPVTNLTMNSITSIQSHPSSILGLLLSESPEMMSSELVVRNSSPPSPPFAVTTTATNASVSQKAVAPTPESSTASSLLLTKPLGTLSGVPVTSVDPLVPKCSSKTSYSLGKGTVANKGSQAFKVSSNYSNAAAGKSKAKPPPISPPIIKIHHLDSETSNSSSSTPSELLTARPLSVNDSIFKLGMGLTSKLTEKKSYTGQENPSNSEFHRSRKGRAPTPYPSSLADADESGAHSYYTNSAMMDDPYPFQSGRTLSTQRNSYNSFGEKGQRPITETGEYSIEEIVSAMDISTSSSMINQQFISQFPTLDGYPLLKSPSTMGGDGNSSVGGNSYERSASLNLPTVLPLSRTHTIQQSEYGYGASFKLRDSDEGSEELTKRGILSEPDDSYDEGYNRNYPLIPISKSRLHALTPLSSTSGFFRLPNRDISITVNGTRKSIGDATARPPRSQPLSTMEGHHDPIERLLLLSQHSHQQQQQSQEQISNVSNVDPVQQQLQRTRSVANWAQEQALIQEKRTKHKARVRALKELRKYDPTATLSINSSDSSFSTLFSDLSENTPSSESWSLTQSQNQSRSSSVGAGVGVGGSSVKKLERFRKQQQMSGANNGKLQSLKEGEPLELSRLELVVRAQEEEEEPGIYIDTDDVLSPIVEVESVGAGVGRPSFRT